MATGILGQASPAAATNTTIYTVPVSKTAVCNISVVNTSGSPIAIRLALAASSTPTSSEYIEYDVLLPAFSVLERGGLVLNASKLVVAYASAAGASISVYGYEE